MISDEKDWYLLLIGLVNIVSEFSPLFRTWKGTGGVGGWGIKWKNIETKPTINLTSNQAFRIQH